MCGNKLGCVRVLVQLHNCMPSTSFHALFFYAQVDSFNRAAHRNTTAGKLTQLFKTKMLSRTSMSSGASPASSSKSPGGSSGGGAAAPASADDLLQWSNVSVLFV